MKTEMKKVQKAVVFDLDGTLADTLTSIAYCGNRALQAVPYPPFPEERYKTFVGDGADELVRRMVRASGDEQEVTYPIVRAKYKEYFDRDAMYEVKPYDGICETIAALKNCGIRIAVLTNKPHAQAIEVVETLFGAGTFDLIVGQDPSRERKPSPQGVFYIAKQLGISPEEIVYLGDTDTDMITGTRAGAYTVGVLWGFRTAEELLANGARRLIRKPQELVTMILRRRNQQIRMIATDIDGTLVKDSSPEVYQEILDAIRVLTDQGIIFVVASGRAYSSISSMFAEVKDRIAYIAENGAHIVYQGKSLAITRMDPQITQEILAELRQYRDTTDYVISTPEGSLLDTKKEAFIALIRDGYHNKYKVVDEIRPQEEDIIKLAIYQKGSIRALGEEKFIPKWASRVKCCMAGEEWVDFMDKTVDKGHALRYLQECLDINAQDTMAFGDNGNDVGMLRAAGESYAVENAIDEVKEAAEYICPSYHTKGVYQILTTIMGE